MRGGSPAPRRRRLCINWAGKARCPVSRAFRQSLPVQTQDLCKLRSPEVKPKVALATCTKGCPPERLREWLFWHLAKGVQLILLRWEGSLDAEQESVLEDLLKRNRVLLLERSLQGKASSSFERVMTRQIRFLHSAIKFAREKGFDFLLHLDDDELLFPEAGTIPELLKGHLQSSKRCVHFENLEAVFPFEVHSHRPLSRAATQFRQDRFALYVNGKSAANLTAPGQVFTSGVHHFCRHDRSFSKADPKFGLHDEAAGCSHPECCVTERGAFVLHFDCPSFSEWQAKFSARAAASMSVMDEEEMDTFPFKKASVKAVQEDVPKQKRVYRHWRCFPGRREEPFHERLTGAVVEAEFERLLAEVRHPAA